MDRNGPLIGVRLSDTRDLAAAEACFRSAWTVTGVTPDRITTDGHDAYPRAIRNVFGGQVRHPGEPLLKSSSGAGSSQHQATVPGNRWAQHVGTAARFCRLFDEIRAVFRPNRTATNP